MSILLLLRMSAYAYAYALVKTSLNRCLVCYPSTFISLKSHTSTHCGPIFDI